ncbi:amidophosphoribosyltransferase [Vermiconidia calcicola]|uniref:Amidophosphoribosyltransferase n=1 Tax=Vermiconidia calcicola TaxID=1690605 RepID=A0ACC3MZ76_9PEZI|nr:amidophosphoribosyltransferase [Vermiconidia calcicola]
MRVTMPDKKPPRHSDPPQKSRLQWHQLHPKEVLDSTDSSTLETSPIEAVDSFTALERTYKRCEGIWACTAVLAGFGLIGFRDAYCIRAMVLGEFPSVRPEGGKDYMMACESVALSQNGYDNIKDFIPGQAIIIEKGEGFGKTIKPVIKANLLNTFVNGVSDTISAVFGHYSRVPALT